MNDTINQNKNILINCLSARSGGAISYLRNVVGKIIEQGNQQPNVNLMAVCDANQTKLVETDPDKIITVNTTGFGGWKRSLWERRNLPSLVKQHQFTTVFTPYQISSFSSPAKSVLMLRNMEPFHFKNYHYSLSTRLRNHILRRATVRSARSAAHVIAVSDFAREQLVEGLKLEPSQVTQIYHGRDHYFSEEIENQFAQKELDHLGIARPFLLTCGSLLPYRRCEDVIEGFVDFCERSNAELDLVIAGDGNDTRYKSLLHELAEKKMNGLSGRIVFTNHVSRSEMRTLYHEAKLVILATEIEACPNIAIEAMSSGAAIVASDSRPLPEIIGRDNACFFEKRNVKQLSDNINNLLSNSEATQNLRERARKRADQFSWDTCSNQTLELLINL